MRIYESEELRRLLGVYLSKETKGKAQSSSIPSDRVEISREGETLSKILRSISNIEEPDITEKLNSIKRAIEEGEYTVDEKVLADRILSGEVPEDIIKAWLGE